jgi:fructose-1,6-bisphosphatase
MEERNKTLGEFIIEKQEEFKYSSGELSRIINSIRLAAKVVNYKVNKAGLVDIVGAVGDQNIQGEDQQKLDVYANDVFIQTLITSTPWDLSAATFCVNALPSPKSKSPKYPMAVQIRVRMPKAD